MPKHKALIEYVLPFESDPETKFINYYSEFNLVVMPLAAAISFARNRDLKWALVHGFLGAPYLAYLAASWADKNA